MSKKRIAADVRWHPLFERFKQDPDAADRELFGRVPYPDRRGFLRGAGLATMAGLLGTSIPFHRNMPSGFLPLALAQQPELLAGKDGLTLLNDRPINAETPPELLNDSVTPTNRMFIRNNGLPPEQVDPDSWELVVDGLVEKPLRLSIADLKRDFKVVTQQLVVECGGNGRAFFEPSASGNQWTYGAVGCPEWTGVRLADVLKAAGVKSEAVYTAHYGADTHLSGDPDKLPISRGVPLDKAMDSGCMIAFEQNGGPLHRMNGAPLRLVVPGWPGSCSHKWLTRIQLRDVVHDGPKMTGKSYRVPAYPVAPGTDVPTEDFIIIQAMPVKSLITQPAANTRLASDKALAVAGHAWAGDRSIKRVDISIDFGATWQKAKLAKPANRHAWQDFSAKVAFPGPGYYEVWARATDSEKRAQPFAIAWNPKGYLNNSMHRVAVQVG